MTQKELLESVLTELNSVKQNLPNGELKLMLSKVNDLQQDVKALQRKLLDPETGLVVKINKNTEAREELEKKAPVHEKYIQDLVEMKKWREGVNKALWIIFGIITAIIVKLIMNIPQT